MPQARRNKDGGLRVTRDLPDDNTGGRLFYFRFRGTMALGPLHADSEDEARAKVRRGWPGRWYEVWETTRGEIDAIWGDKRRDAAEMRRHGHALCATDL